MAYRTRDLLVRHRADDQRSTGASRRARHRRPGRPGAHRPPRRTRRGESGALPEAVRDLARLLLIQITGLSERIAGLDLDLRRCASADDTARRLTTIPGVGPITAAAITTFAPPMETFAKGRDFAARVRLTPRQHSSGGKERR